MTARSSRINPLKDEDDQEDHDGELWLVSYADMVTLLFGFFVILFSLSSLDEKKFDQISEEVAKSFKSKDEKKTTDSNVGVSSETRQLRALQMLVAMLNLGDNLDDAVAKVEKSFADGKTVEGAKAVLVEKVAGENKGLIQGIKATKDEEFQIIELVLPDSSLFPSGSYHLTQEATTRLKALVDGLRQVADLAEIEIIGHTDSQQPSPGTYDNNFTLSSLRAGAVAGVFTRFGIDKKKLTVRGMGDLKPLLPERAADGKLNPINMAKNRRVNVILKVRRNHVSLGR